MDRGDIWHLDFSPAAGRELRGAHYALIVSPRAFNLMGKPLVCPISTTGASFARAGGWTVTLMGAGTATAGMILCHELRTIDMKARSGRFHEKVPDSIMDEVLAIVQALVE
ncbi:type II toxin-antitoxin system PemK/MazF family toxin [Geminicoccus sp.]|uniref:type II toxin-antitoxin system PemK/MazF family toxin n=1 Tax=Geminicoccus sp. TaxID=2024832 RepID=UPI002E304048|nr:type II toxin-antitoxin system PemK/MazF family toxin [Geminicoccus sp.]